MADDAERGLGFKAKISGLGLAKQGFSLVSCDLVVKLTAAI